MAMEKYGVRRLAVANGPNIFQMLLVFGSSRRAEMLCGREGNRRSGIALAMRHRLKWLVHLQVQGLSNGDEHPTIYLLMVYGKVR